MDLCVYDVLRLDFRDQSLRLFSFLSASTLSFTQTSWVLQPIRGKYLKVTYKVITPRHGYTTNALVWMQFVWDFKSSSVLLLVRLSFISRWLTVNLSPRKIPGLNVYAQMQNEKEQEMMSPANPTEATPSSRRDLVHSLEILDTEFNSRPIGECPLSCESLPGAGIFIFFSSICGTIACFMTPVLCFLFLRGKLVRSRGERGLNKKEHDTKVHCSPLYCFPLITCEHRQVTSDREIYIRNGFSMWFMSFSCYYHSIVTTESTIIPRVRALAFFFRVSTRSSRSVTSLWILTRYLWGRIDLFSSLRPYPFESPFWI